jgi:DNA repair exonuclease SbcCD nuclease subunit
MKIAIITDQHFGARNDSLHFLDFYEKFYSETFFPKLDESGIKTLLILGDTFDRRKYVNFYSLQRAKKMFFDGLFERDILVYMLVGNHDTYYKNTNEVNSPELLLEDYTNISVIESPQTLHLDYGNVKADVCMMPWICVDNYDRSMEEIKNTTATVCMGHFEIEGFQMYRGAPSHEGLEPKMFNKFDQVFSGHYHHKSSRGNIHYLGNPYELTWQDHNDPRGFHFFDLKTHELEFVENPNRMFMKLVYDDKVDDIKTITNMDLSHLTSTYVKVVVINKTNPYLFDMMINNLYKVNPIDITIAEDFTELEEIEENDVDQAEDTTTILNKYVDNLSTDLDKDKLKTMMRYLYIEAMNEEN